MLLLRLIEWSLVLVLVATGAVVVWAMRQGRRAPTHVSGDEPLITHTEQQLQVSRKILEDKRKTLLNLTELAANQAEIDRLEAEIEAKRREREQNWRAL
jgi:hypothetical protein